MSNIATAPTGSTEMRPANPATSGDLAVTDPAFTETAFTDLAFTDTGSGPAVLLVHGLISDRRTWSAEIEALSASHRVIAPDLAGHGESVGRTAGGPSHRDYSLGGHAASLRDLLEQLKISDVTVVGHSLGGGIAMEMAYLFPDLVNGLVLVSSGGLGPELSPALRAATLPGSEWVLPLFGLDWLRQCGDTVLGLPARLGLPTVSPSTAAAWSGMATFGNPGLRQGFLATSRSVIGLSGQTVSALPLLKMLGQRPVLVMWGGRDHLIPSSHAAAIEDALPGTAIHIFRRAGHFPHLDEPELFHRLLTEFLDSHPAQDRRSGATKTRPARRR